MLIDLEELRGLENLQSLYVADSNEEQVFTNCFADTQNTSVASLVPVFPTTTKYQAVYRESPGSWHGARSLWGCFRQRYTWENTTLQNTSTGI